MLLLEKRGQSHQKHRFVAASVGIITVYKHKSSYPEKFSFAILAVLALFVVLTLAAQRIDLIKEKKARSLPDS